jgi:DNA (cytosine-5)-methyltransferase 1
MNAAGYKHPDVPWNGLTATDLFCGAGGSSSGLVEAGYRVVIAANHWELAIQSHQVNHPETDHAQADISQVDPRYFPTTDLLWASPECTNHSIAKGVKRLRAENEALFELEGARPLVDEAANRSRATMWDVPRFAEYHRYKAIIIENVVDAAKWIMFPAWLQAMELLGYRHQMVWLNSMHAQVGGLPAPQSRDRMYIVFWRTDLVSKRRQGPNVGRWTRPLAVCAEHGEVRAVQTFKKATEWGRYRAQYVYRCPSCAAVVEPGWLPALSIIDWSIQGQRIGDRERPLAPKTRLRVEKAIERYWRPIVVTAAGNTYDGITTGSNYLRARPVDDVLPTQHTTASEALAVPPLLAQFRERERTIDASTSPLPTVVADDANHALLTPMMVPVEGRDGKHAAPATDPLRTQSTRNETALIVPMRNHGVAKPATEPIDTVSANGNHHALVMSYYSRDDAVRPASDALATVTTEPRHALLMRNFTPRGDAAQMSTPVTEPMRAITTAGHQSLLEPSEPISLDVDDVLFRMLEPHEIKLGMGFAADYLLLGTKRDKVKQAGNAVTPPCARDLGFAVAEFLAPEAVAA